MRKSSGSILGALVGVSIMLTACGTDTKKADESDGAAPKTTAGDIGTVKVGVWPHMPYSGVASDGSAEGLDVDILNSLSKKLNFAIDPSSTNFVGALAAVQAGRLDMTLGSVGWTEERMKTGIATDPLYYNPVGVVTKQGEIAGAECTVAELEGKTVGVKTGSLIVEPLSAISGVKVRSYPDDQSGIADVSTGRIFAFLTDPLIGSFAGETNPGLGIEAKPMKPPTDEQLLETPKFTMFHPYQVILYLGKDMQAFADSLSKEIRKMYENGELRDLIEKRGGDPDAMLRAPSVATEQRVGVDRPDTWQAPTG